MGTTPSLWGSMILRYRWDYGTLARRVLTFALDGQSALPPRRDPAWSKVEDPTFKRDDALAATGSGIFAVHCVTCHGGGAVSAGMAPDLRRSSVPLSPAAFRSVVHDGALLKLGMPQFDEFDDAQLGAIRQYIRAQAHDPRLEVESSGPVPAY
jgi:quinohemoprotein ethanol dehydrogenase